jgi:hypothetical protein
MRGIYIYMPHLLKWQEFLEYEQYIKGIMLNIWSSLRSIKSWIMIYYGEFKFPQTATVLVPLSSDDACTSLNGHSAWKSTVLVLVWCYKAVSDREQDLLGYWLPEGYIKKLYDKPTGDGCLFKKYAWESNEAGCPTINVRSCHQELK